MMMIKFIESEIYLIILLSESIIMILNILSLLIIIIIHLIFYQLKNSSFIPLNSICYES